MTLQERIARAFWRGLVKDSSKWEDLAIEGRDALVAAAGEVVTELQEPSEEMIEAGNQAVLATDDGEDEIGTYFSTGITREAALHCWHAMLNAVGDDPTIHAPAQASMFHARIEELEEGIREIEIFAYRGHPLRDGFSHSRRLLKELEQDVDYIASAARSLLAGSNVGKSHNSLQAGEKA